MVGDARDDWEIIRAFSEGADVRMPCDSHSAMVAANLHTDAREPVIFSCSFESESPQEMSTVSFGTGSDRIFTRIWTRCRCSCDFVWFSRIIVLVTLFDVFSH